MPVYQYACTECSEQLEVRQSFVDDALTVCPACEGRLRKILSAVGVVFKGSGFYRNDSRSSPTGEASTSDGSPASTSPDGSSSSSESNNGTPAGSGSKDRDSQGSGSKDGDSRGSGSKDRDSDGSKGGSADGSGAKDPTSRGSGPSKSTKVVAS
ncbi:MAG: FmdB family transcriptional regulator [Propionibacteriales bacterium]|nr:FmdB family transcriptional regulator [Propionibacteriales bacterium]